MRIVICLLIFSITISAQQTINKAFIKQIGERYKLDNQQAEALSIAWNGTKERNSSHGRMSDYYVFTNIENKVNANYNWFCDIEVFQDNLIRKMIHRISDSENSYILTNDNLITQSGCISEYLYNEDRQLTKIESYSYYDQDNQYIGKNLITFSDYTYEEGRLIKIVSNFLSFGQKFTSKYEYSENQVVITSWTKYENQDERYMARQTNVYQNDLLKTSFEELFNISNSAFQPSSKTEYIRNSNNKVIREEYYTYQNGIYELNQTKELEYNSNGECIYSTTKIGSTIIELSYTYENRGFISAITPKDYQEIESGETIAFNLYGYNTDNVNIYYSVNSDSDLDTLVENLNISGTENFRFPIHNAGEYFVKIVDADNSDIEEVVYLKNPDINTYDNLKHNTNNIKFEISNDGSFSDPVFEFIDNNNVLFGGGFAIMKPDGVIKGSLSEFDLNDFENSRSLFPFFKRENYNQISSCEFTEKSPELGLSVKQRTYSNRGDDFVILRYNVINETSETIEDVYFGLFADLDIGNSVDNMGGVDLTNRLVYQYAPSSNYYYGIVAFQDVTGANVTTTLNSQDLEASLYSNFMTTGSNNTVQGDYRSYITSGPANITPENSFNFTFAMVAGESLDDLVNNANLAAQKAMITSVEEQQVDLTPQDYILSQNYPNPFNPVTTIQFSLPASEYVELNVYNVLGEQVARLVNGELSAGTHQVRFNASLLSSGIYFYQIKAGEFIQTRKMMLIK